MAVVLQDINLEQLSTEQLIGLDRALGSFVFKQSGGGEDYHPTYKRDKQSFELLTKTTLSLQRGIKSYFSNLAGNIQKLVDVQKITAADTAGYLDDSEWDFAEEELVKVLHKGLIPIYEVGSKATAKELGVQTKITSQDAPSQEFLRKYSLQLAGDLTKETKSRVKETIKTSLALGEDRDTLTAKLSDILDDDYRSQMIAQTESIRAYSQGRLAVGEELGYKQKEWEWPGDSKCGICPDLADQDPIGIDETWELDNGEEVDAPPAHPNCRCSVRLIKGDEDIEGKEQLITVKAGWITKDGRHLYVNEEEDRSERENKLLDKFGTTSDPKQASFITSDGNFVRVPKEPSLWEQAQGKIPSHEKMLMSTLTKKEADKLGNSMDTFNQLGFFLNNNNLIRMFYADKGMFSDAKLYIETHRKPTTNQMQVIKDITKGGLKMDYDIFAGAKGETAAKSDGTFKQFQNDVFKTFYSKKGSEPVINESGRVIKAGWVTMNGNHIFIPDSPEDIVKNSTGKTLGQIQREHEAATGLGPLTDFQDAMSAHNYEKADKLYKVIQDAKPESPLAAYKSTVTSLYTSHKQAVMGKQAFDFSQYQDLDQSTMNLKVYEQFATDFPADAPSLENFNFSIKEVPIKTIDDNVAGLPDKALRYAEDMKRGDKFPPLVVLHFGGNNNLADGAHRIEALKINGATNATVLYGVPR